MSIATPTTLPPPTQIFGPTAIIGATATTIRTFRRAARHGVSVYLAGVVQDVMEAVFGLFKKYKVPPRTLAWALARAVIRLVNRLSTNTTWALVGLRGMRAMPRLIAPKWWQPARLTVTSLDPPASTSRFFRPEATASSTRELLSACVIRPTSRTSRTGKSSRKTEDSFGTRRLPRRATPRQTNQDPTSIGHNSPC